MAVGKTTQGERDAWERLRLIDENEYWKIFEERGNRRIWARRKEALKVFVLPIEEEKRDRNKRKTFNL